MSYVIIFFLSNSDNTDEIMSVIFPEEPILLCSQKSLKYSFLSDFNFMKFESLISTIAINFILSCLRVLLFYTFYFFICQRDSFHNPLLVLLINRHYFMGSVTGRLKNSRSFSFNNTFGFKRFFCSNSPKQLHKHSFPL